MTVVQFPVGGKPRRTADVHWNCIKEFTQTENGQLVVLGHSTSKDGRTSYGVLLMSGVDNGVDGFDIICEYPDTPAGKASAEVAAEIADRTLGASCMLMPEPATA